MIYGVAIGVGLVVLLVVLALRDRFEGRARPQPVNTGDGGAPASYVGTGSNDHWPSSSTTSDSWECEPRDQRPDECAPGDNPGDAEQCDTGDSGSDGGSGGSD